MNFVAVDVETANESRASICQIGMAKYDNGILVDTWSSLVDPRDLFNDRNVSIHKITASTVAGAPTFQALAATVHAWLENANVVCHTAFDQVSLRRAFEAVGRETPTCNWLDTARVARRVWSERAHKGYGLASICEFLKYEYRAHDALEDAKACGHVLQEAVKASGLGIDEWLTRSKAPLHFERIEVTGPLSELVIVFTGKLEMTRAEAAGLAASLGATVSESVGKHTTHLVVGDQDIRRLAGHEKSSKHRKAEQLIAAGQDLLIVQESDFLDLIKCSSEKPQAVSVA